MQEKKRHNVTALSILYQREEDDVEARDGFRFSLLCVHLFCAGVWLLKRYEFDHTSAGRESHEPLELNDITESCGLRFDRPSYCFRCGIPKTIKTAQAMGAVQDTETRY